MESLRTQEIYLEREDKVKHTLCRNKPSRALGHWAAPSFHGNLISEVFEGEGYVES